LPGLGRRGAARRSAASQGRGSPGDDRQEHGSPGAPSLGSGAGGAAAVFLQHCRWDPERLENEWFSDERRIREAMGLTAD